MPVGAAIGIGGLASAGASVYGASKAVKAQQGMFNTARGQLQPFIDAGKDALNPLQKLITPGQDMTKELEMMPGYRFVRDQGLKGVTNQATTRGLGGNAMREGANFAENFALNNSWGPIVNALQNLVGTGANSGGNLATAATTTGSGIAGTIASGANAVGGAANSASNVAGQYAMFNKLFGNGSAPGTVNAGVYGNSAPVDPWMGLR